MDKRRAKEGKGSKAPAGHDRAGAPDPRLVDLVRYLARRAAERDYTRLRSAEREGD